MSRGYRLFSGYAIGRRTTVHKHCCVVSLFVSFYVMNYAIGRNLDLSPCLLSQDQEEQGVCCSV